MDQDAEPQMGQAACPRSHRQAEEDPDLWLESRLLQGPGVQLWQRQCQRTFAWGLD